MKNEWGTVFIIFQLACITILLAIIAGRIGS